jgi:hypothetical protein
VPPVGHPDHFTGGSSIKVLRQVLFEFSDADVHVDTILDNMDTWYPGVPATISDRAQAA